MKKSKAKKIIHPKNKVELIENVKKPIFTLGVLTWVALFVFIFGTTYLRFQTGHAISSGETFGVSTSVVLVILLIVLAVLLYFVWKLLIKKAKR